MILILGGLSIVLWVFSRRQRRRHTADMNTVVKRVEQAVSSIHEASVRLEQGEYAECERLLNAAVAHGRSVVGLCDARRR